MANMNIVIGLEKPMGKRGAPGDELDQGDKNEGEDAELTEYELGAESMRDRACALAAMHGAGKRPAKSLDKMIEELPLDERKTAAASKTSDANSIHEPNEDTKY